MASISRTKNGKRWQVRYRDANRRDRQRTFSRKADAERFRATVVADIARGDWIDPERAKETVGQWADRLVAAKEGTIKDSSALRNAVTLDKQIKPHWADVPLGSVTHGDVLGWISSMRADGLSPSSMRKARGMLSEIFALAERSGAHKGNPVTGTKIPTGPKREHRYLTPEEIRQLAHEIANPPRHRSRPYDSERGDLALMVRFAAGTGLRQGELLALAPTRVDFEKRRVIVAESLADVAGTLKVGPTKTDRTRSVPLTESLLEPLERQIAKNKRAQFVWPNRDGGPMRGNLLYRRHFLPAAERAGLHGQGRERVRFHDLRHTYAALLIALNAPPKAIQSWMGHSSISVTLDVYGHLFPFAEDEVASRLDALMSE